MTISFSYIGVPLTHQKIVPGNVITSMSSYCYRYSLWKLNFDAGTAGNAIVANDWVIGATSSAAGRVRYISAITGSWAGNDAAGYVLIDSWNGTAWTDDEKIKVAADATMADVNQPAAIVEATDEEYRLAGMLDYKHKIARYAQVIVHTATVLMSFTGAKPDQTALIGLPIGAGGGFSITDANGMSGFKCIDYAAGAGGIVQIEFFF